MSGAESASSETYGFDAGRGSQAAKGPDTLLEQSGVASKDLEPVPPVPQSPAVLVQEIKAAVSAEMALMTKVSKIMLCVSDNIAELVIVHDYPHISKAISETWENINRLEDTFPNVIFEPTYPFSRHFDEKKVHPDLTDVNA